MKSVTTKLEPTLISDLFEIKVRVSNIIYNGEFDPGSG